MTGLIGMAQTLAISALAATGLLMAGGQFHTDGQASVSSSTGAAASAGTGSGGQTSTGIAADASVESEVTISADTDCLDNNCPAPCATACTDPLRPALDGAVEDAAAFGATVAPEPPCLCADESSSVALEAEGDAGLESDSSTTDLGASSGAFASFGIAGN
jgi:hypothetical protein